MVYLDTYLTGIDFFSPLGDLRYLFSIGVSLPRWTTGTGIPCFTVNLIGYFVDGDWFLFGEVSPTPPILYTLGVIGLS